MYKWTLTYKDYGDEPEEITEDFYFNLNKAEMLEMEWSTVGGIEASVNKMFVDRDTAGLTKFFKDLIIKSFGVRTSDMKGFSKDPEITKKFMQTRAYEEIFWQLGTNPDAAIKFLKGIFPSEVNGQKIDYDAAFKEAGFDVEESTPQITSVEEVEESADNNDSGNS